MYSCVFKINPLMTNGVQSAYFQFGPTINLHDEDVMIRARFFITLFLLFVTTGTFAADTDTDTKARALFELFFEESVSLSPMWQTDLGRKTNYDKWDDISPQQSEL